MTQIACVGIDVLPSRDQGFPIEHYTELKLLISAVADFHLGAAPRIGY
jgi:hypothetical protein